MTSTSQHVVPRRPSLKRLLPLTVMTAAAVVLAPQMAAANNLVLFPAHNVFASPSSSEIDGSQPSFSRISVLSLFLPRTPCGAVRS